MIRCNSSCSRMLASLEMRTEGWIAGLQLAALSLQSQADPAAFIATFSGNDRFIADYLFEEIWRHQTEDVRQFLLQTSILEKLSGLLCDAVQESSGSQEMLEMLEARQLFTAPLDHQRHWFRYHTLFKEMLNQRLAADSARDAATPAPGCQPLVRTGRPDGGCYPAQPESR